MSATDHTPCRYCWSLYTYRATRKLTKERTVIQGHWLELLPSLLYTNYSRSHKFHAVMNRQGSVQSNCKLIAHKYIYTPKNFQMLRWFCRLEYSMMVTLIQ
jgi:hypothetical protein